MGLVRRSVDGLMDRSLPPQELALVQSTIQATLRPGHVIRELRTRRSGQRRFVEFKLCVPAELTVAAAHDECDALEHALGEALRRTSVLIHVEPLDTRTAPQPL